MKFFVDSAQYHSAWSIFDTKNRISRKTTKIENILTHWSVARAGSNDEKTRGRKSRWTVSLIYAIIFY